MMVKVWYRKETIGIEKENLRYSHKIDVSYIMSNRNIFVCAALRVQNDVKKVRLNKVKVNVLNVLTC